MSSESESPTTPPLKKQVRSRSAQIFLRGLAITLPPILTIVILLWLGQAIYDYVIYPTSKAVQWTTARIIQKSQPTKDLAKWDQLPPLEYSGTKYLISESYKAELQQIVQRRSDGLTEGDIERDEVFVPLGDGRAVPYEKYVVVARQMGPEDVPRNVTEFYMEVVTRERFQSFFHMPAFSVLISLMLVYFAGRFVTARVGSWAVHRFETRILSRVPIISNVYSSVKQVTDFIFTERTVEYNRVVAVEYPRRGIWSLGFVTGDSMLEIAAAAGEPMVAVLIPTSPMPMTGFTVSIPRSEIVDLDLTIDQAFQFCLSCGVLVPAQQTITPELLQQEFAKRFSQDAFDVRNSRSKQRYVQGTAAPISPPVVASPADESGESADPPGQPPVDPNK